MEYPFNLESLFWLPVGYLFGCFSFSYFVGLIYGVELTKEGKTKTASVSNLGREAGALAALLAVTGEVLKASIVVILALSFTKGNAWAAALASAGAILGHCYPWWLNYRGGKAMSAAAGALLAVAAVEKEMLYILIPAAIVAFPMWWLTWRVSAGSISAAITAALVTSVMMSILRPEANLPEPYFWLVLVVSAVALLRLRENFQRLIAGTEHRTPFLWWRRFPRPPWIQPD